MIGRPPHSDARLDPEQMAAEPMDEFVAWYEAAVEAEVVQPNAMSLATSMDDRPSVRTVLLKDYGPDGLVFYTNYGSRKGRQLEHNPRAAVSFNWLELHQAIRVEGTVEKLSEEASDAYYASRPRGAQLAAGVSRQSEEIPSDDHLERAFAAASEKFAEEPIPRPDYWGGYRLSPDVVEFWQGRPDRLHHRIRYHQHEGEWVKEWLSP
ncbi:MAG: pyridoxamine 5'-phosphate oxidase [Acidimicrobiia bacterium]